MTWVTPTETPVSFGANGQSGLIWTGAIGGPVPGISTNAQWIWSAEDPTGEAFFSTPIYTVPEPATWVLMFAGFAGL